MNLTPPRQHLPREIILIHRRKKHLNVFLLLRFGQVFCLLKHLFRSHTAKTTAYLLHSQPNLFGPFVVILNQIVTNPNNIVTSRAE